MPLLAASCLRSTLLGNLSQGLTASKNAEFAISILPTAHHPAAELFSKLDVQEGDRLLLHRQASAAAARVPGDRPPLLVAAKVAREGPGEQALQQALAVAAAAAGVSAPAPVPASNKDTGVAADTADAGAAADSPAPMLQENPAAAVVDAKQHQKQLPVARHMFYAAAAAPAANGKRQQPDQHATAAAGGRQKQQARRSIARRMFRAAAAPAADTAAAAAAGVAARAAVANAGQAPGQQPARPQPAPQQPVQQAQQAQQAQQGHLDLLSLLMEASNLPAAAAAGLTAELVGGFWAVMVTLSLEEQAARVGGCYVLGVQQV